MGELAPGTVTLDGEIVTATQPLEIVEIQPEGKRPMSLAAYRNGHRWEPFMHLESLA